MKQADSKYGSADGQCVYIVDGDHESRIALAEKFGDLGIECKTFESAECFLEGIQSEPFGCLILEWNLPSMCASQLLDEMRALGWLTPTIMLTNNIKVEDAISSIRKGVLDVMLKPVEFKIILQAVEVVLSICPPLKPSLDQTKIRQTVLSLPDTERKVMRLMLAGRQNKSIAFRLGIGMRSVVRYRTKILSQFGCDSPTSLMRLLSATGLLDRLPLRRPSGFRPISDKIRVEIQENLGLISSEVTRLATFFRQGDQVDGNVIEEKIGACLKNLADDSWLTEPAKSPISNSGPAKGLVVVSDPQEANWISGILELIELEPKIVDENAAIETLSQPDLEFDLLIVGVNSNDKHGLSLLEELSRCPSHDDVFTILLTDCFDEYDGSDAFARANQIMMRPVNSVTLVNKILHCLHSNFGSD